MNDQVLFLPLEDLRIVNTNPRGRLSIEELVEPKIAFITVSRMSSFKTLYSRNEDQKMSKYSPETLQL